MLVKNNGIANKRHSCDKAKSYIDDITFNYAIYIKFLLKASYQHINDTNRLVLNNG